MARGLRGYLAGATAARAGDEMSGPALLLLGFAVTGRPAAGSGLLASVTVAGAVGGPVFGALLDRSRRPDRVLAWALGGYALGITAVQAVLRGVTLGCAVRARTPVTVAGIACSICSAPEPCVAASPRGKVCVRGEVTSKICRIGRQCQ